MTTSPQIDFSVLSEGIEILKRRLGPFAAMGAMYFGVTLILIGGLAVVWLGTIMAVLGATRGDNLFAMLIAMYANPAFWAIIGLSLFLPLFFQAAFVGMANQELSGGKATVGGGLQAIRSHLKPLLILSLLMTGAQLLCYFSCSLLMIFVQAAFYIAIPMVLSDPQTRPTEILRLSFERIRPHYWYVLGIAFLGGIIASVGGILCGVGVVLTAPLIGIYPAVIYYKLWNSSQPAAGNPYPRGDGPASALPIDGATISTEMPRPEQFADAPPRDEAPEYPQNLPLGEVSESSDRFEVDGADHKNDPPTA